MKNKEIIVDKEERDSELNVAHEQMHFMAFLFDCELHFYSTIRSLLQSLLTFLPAVLRIVCDDSFENFYSSRAKVFLEVLFD